MVNAHSIPSPEPARRDDLEAVVALLQAANLPAADVEPHFDNFLVVREAGRVIGAIGFEAHGADALLRSAVVDPASRGTGLGRLLFEHVLRLARRRGVRTVYVLTTTVDMVLDRIGFERCDRAAAPPAIADSAEFRSLCPASAAFMRLRLDDGGGGMTD